MPSFPSEPQSSDASAAPFRLTRRTVLSGLSAAALAGVGLAVSNGARAAVTPVGTPEANATPQAGGSWTIGIPEEPDTLDPHKTGAAITQTIMRNVCDPLIAKDFD